MARLLGSAQSDFQLGLDFSWELDVWGRIRRTVESNQASAQASAGDLESARLSFQAELAQDYFQLRTLDAQKQLLDATVAAFEKSLELTQNRYASGVASQADVVQARDPAQDHPGPGDRRGRAARPVRARHRPAHRQASVDLLASRGAARRHAARHSRRRAVGAPRAPAGHRRRRAPRGGRERPDRGRRGGVLSRPSR